MNGPAAWGIYGLLLLLYCFVVFIETNTERMVLRLDQNIVIMEGKR